MDALWSAELETPPEYPVTAPETLTTSLTDFSEVALFKHLFGIDTMAIILRATQEYAALKGESDFVVGMEEIGAFIGLFILMGCCVKGRMPDYWNVDAPDHTSLTSYKTKKSRKRKRESDDLSSE